MRTTHLLLVLFASVAPEVSRADGLPAADEILAGSVPTLQRPERRPRRSRVARHRPHLRRQALTTLPVERWPRADVGPLRPSTPSPPESSVARSSPVAPSPRATPSARVDRRRRSAEGAALDDEVTPSRARPPMLSLAAGMSASMRTQVLSLGTGERLEYRVRGFTSARAVVVLSPLAHLPGAVRGIGLEALYERALHMEVSIEGRPVEASADHLALAVRWELALPGGVSVQPHAGWDLTRFPLQENRVLSGIEYSSVAAGAAVSIPLLADRLWLSAAGSVALPLGFGEAGRAYGPARRGVGTSVEVALSGAALESVRWQVRLARTAFDVTFEDAESEDATTTLGCDLALGL